MINSRKRALSEIHLATGFQNIIYDSANSPEEVRDKIYEYINTDLRGEKKEADTEEQFVYKTRKKGFGPFKEAPWNLPPDMLEKIGAELERQFAFLFDKLNVRNTKELVDKYVKLVDVPRTVPDILSK